MSWTHTPRLPVLLWTAFTFPFTIWDTLYIILRPHTLPGHKWHDPIWTPVGAYAAVDGVYGEQAWLESEGWTAAQSVVNVTEVLLYLWYYAIVRRGRSEANVVGGRAGGKACVVGLVAGTVTLTKSMLYLMREAFSGFKYVGKADWWSLLTTWILMNVLYISFSSYMIASFAEDILNGFSSLENKVIASEKGKRT